LYFVLVNKIDDLMKSILLKSHENMLIVFLVFTPYEEIQSIYEIPGQKTIMISPSSVN
jgi:hypothetical protein